MKWILASLLVFATLPASLVAAAPSLTEKASPTINFEEPPFYMMSFYEMTELAPEQRSFYAVRTLKRLGALATKTISPFLGYTSDLIEKKMKLEDEWKDLMTAVYRACAEPKNKAVCEQMMKDRLDTFAKKDRGSEEDRKLDHSTSQPTTLPASK